MSVEINGADEIKEKLKALAKDFPAVAIKGITAEARIILAEAQQLTPVDTGRLRQSAYVAPPETEEGNQHVRVGYGVDYALAVHEKTEVRHPTGQAKFLSTPVDAHKGTFAHDVAERIKADPKIEEWKKGDL